MRIGKRKTLAAAFGLLTTGVAVAAWYLGGTDALLAVIIAAVVLGLGLTVNVIVQLERRLHSVLRDYAGRAVGQVKHEMRDSVAVLSEALVSHLDIRIDDLDRKLQRPGEQTEMTLRAIKAGHTRLQLEQDRRLRAIERTMTRLLKHSPAEIDALLQVHRRSELDDPLPLMGGWALSPRGLLQAIDIVTDPRVSLVVECGSGTSTLFLARALQLKGSGKLISLEHLDEYHELTRKGLEQHGLSEIAEVRHAPLEEFSLDGSAYEWYAHSSTADLFDIDVLIVDGPPGSIGDWARYPAYPLLRERLTPAATVLVDDVQRADEKSIVDAWLQIGGLSQLASSSNDQAVLRVGP